ncbi:MAG TPA: alpha/beta hydrolase [Acidimicrobiales bacterium]|nr:alpha/beta hydrolase [Acidimicrobiales bacterium]
MRTSVETGQTLAFDRHGDPSAAPVVLLHGLSGSRLAYRNVADEIDGDVWNVDERGHGESTRATLETYDASSYAADIAALIETQVRRPASVVGHSLGGVVALTLAQSRPDLVTAIFLEDPPLYEGDAARRAASPTAKFFPAMIAAVRERQARGAAADEYRSIVVETAPDEVDARCQSLVLWDPTTMQAAIDGIVWKEFDPDARVGCPVTIVRADPKVGAVFTPDDADQFTTSNPHVRIAMVEGATHTVHASPTLGAYLIHLRRFLAER